MRPDRVVGFHINNRYREYIASYPTVLTHCPVETMELIYPFLVIEAKKESDAPGFRSVEAQTAFSIRRLLKIQDDLRTTGQNNHDPLVWFFGFQGEVWRLYAGTLDGEKVVSLTVLGMCRYQCSHKLCSKFLTYGLAV